MAAIVHSGTPPSPSPSSFPNFGVSLAFLEDILQSPKLQTPMVDLLHPGLDLDTLGTPALRKLGQEMRVFSQLSGDEEFARYGPASTITDDEWRRMVRSPPVTTTQVNVCVIKPMTQGTGACYALSIVKKGPHPEWVGTPTDFVSHAWRYQFKPLVVALRAEAEERDQSLVQNGLAPIAHTRFYWNDIFVEDQNATDSKPEGYFFHAFRDAIQSIGRTILILMPLRAAIPLSRAWCVWEMFCSIQGSGVELCVALPPSERMELERMLNYEFDEIVNILTNVHVEHSEAFKASDKNEIHRFVRDECDGGFNGVNGVICDGLRKWLVGQGERR